jgi:hypothetical protein
MTELAFLRAYLAWEVFLEETFVSYLVGMRAPRGRAPRRYAFPPNRRAAEQWVVPEGRPFAKWDAVAVANRADRFFGGGGPYTSAIRSHQSALDEMKTIRNAVAHESQNAQEKFETLVRVKLRSLPPRLTVGSFLLATVAGSTPATSFLDSYLSKLQLIASLIVPT